MIQVHTHMHLFLHLLSLLSPSLLYLLPLPPSIPQIMFTTTGDQIFQFPPTPFPSNDRRWKPTVEHAPNCPRCASANTKFCYYNNYSLSQPRYFCKGCRRYWTKGGSLRNVPVGGGCRKNRRGRAARLACQQHARSYLHNNDPGNTKDSLAHLQPGGSDPKSDIDLAVVFANFLNPNSNSTNSSDQSPESELPNDGNGSIQLSNCSSHDMMYPVDQEVEFLQEFPDLSRVVAGEKQSRNQEDPELMNMEGHDEMNALYYNQHIQSLLGDELVQDVLWSSPDQDQPDPNWQPMMQLQDLDLLQSGSDGADCSKLNSTMNLTGDNWSSFDFSAFEVFPRP